MNDPFVLLPANLADLARIAAGESAYAPRLTFSGVRVEVHDGGYHAVATDGRHLALISGPSQGDPLTYPPLPELADLPPCHEAATLPAKAWREMFRQAPRERPGSPGSGVVAVHLGEKESLLAVADEESARVETVVNVEGRFPNYRAVIPTREPRARIDLNPQFLITIAQIARELLAKEENPRLSLEVHEQNAPLVLRARAGSQEMVALIMPLV